MDEEGLGSPKCFESSMIFQLITVFTWRFDGSATWRYWVARSRAAGQLFNSWCVTPRLRELVWFWPRIASFSNCLGRFGRLTLMCCVSFARRLSMFFKQLGDRSRFEDGMFHCFPELYMLQYHAVCFVVGQAFVKTVFWNTSNDTFYMIFWSLRFPSIWKCDTDPVYAPILWLLRYTDIEPTVSRLWQWSTSQRWWTSGMIWAHPQTILLWKQGHRGCWPFQQGWRWVGLGVPYFQS